MAMNPTTVLVNRDKDRVFRRHNASWGLKVYWFLRQSSPVLVYPRLMWLQSTLQNQKKDTPEGQLAHRIGFLYTTTTCNDVTILGVKGRLSLFHSITTVRSGPFFLGCLQTGKSPCCCGTTVKNGLRRDCSFPRLETGVLDWIPTW